MDLAVGEPPESGREADATGASAAHVGQAWACEGRRSSEEG